jgi:hypothetical protein
MSVILLPLHPPTHTQVTTMQSQSLCRFRTFILNFSSFTSAWLLALIATDRLIRARLPFRQAQICTRKVAACSVVVVCVCSTALTYHVLQSEFGFINHWHNYCGPLLLPPTSYSIFYSNIWPILQSITTYFTPSCLMIVCVIGIHAKAREQRTLVAASMRRVKLQRQMLILMISSIVCFAICTLPLSIYSIILLRLGATSQSASIVSILTIFSNINYCCNFYIHCLTSRLFRQTFIQKTKQFMMILKKQREQSNNVVHPLPIINRQHQPPLVD